MVTRWDFVGSLGYKFHKLGDTTWPCRYIDSSGVSRVVGATDLKMSQHYPSLFGRTIAETYLRHLSHTRALATERRLAPCTQTQLFDDKMIMMIFQNNVCWNDSRYQSLVPRALGIPSLIVGMSCCAPKDLKTSRTVFHGHEFHGCFTAMNSRPWISRFFHGFRDDIIYIYIFIYQFILYIYIYM